MKKFWIKKGIMFFFIFIGTVLLFGLLVMSLWNAILPVVLGVKSITFLQALGILLLSKILFGSFKGGFGRRRHHKETWMAMQQKFASMNPEEREKFKFHIALATLNLVDKRKLYLKQKIFIKK